MMILSIHGVMMIFLATSRHGYVVLDTDANKAYVSSTNDISDYTGFLPFPVALPEGHDGKRFVEQ